MPIYEIAIMGVASDTQMGAVEACVSRALAPFGLRLNSEVGCAIRPANFDPDQKVPASSCLLWPTRSRGPTPYITYSPRGVPIIPVARTPQQYHE